MANAAGIDAPTVATLEQLGIRLNYNAYGSAISDLCFDPHDLARQMLPFADPMAFVRDAPAFARLGEAIRPRIVDIRAVGDDVRITARLET